MVTNRNASRRPRRANRKTRRRPQTQLATHSWRASILADAINPWTTQPTPNFDVASGYINRQVVFVPGEAVQAVTTDANGEFAFAFHATPQGQFNWTSSADNAIAAGTYSPDFTTAANDLCSTGILGTSQYHYLVSAGFEYIPAIPLSSAGGYGLATAYTTKTEAASISMGTINPGHDHFFNIRKPLTFLENGVTATTSGVLEASDSGQGSHVVILRFYGPASTTIGYIHMRMITETVLDVTQTFGHVPKRHVGLIPHDSHLRLSMPNFFKTTKDRVVNYIHDAAHKVASTAVHNLANRAFSIGSGIVGTLVGGPSAGIGAYSAAHAIEDMARDVD